MILGREFQREGAEMDVTGWVFVSYLMPYAKMMSPIRTPMVPSRYQTSVWCLKTSALIRMENPMMEPTRELNPEKQNRIGQKVTRVYVLHV